MSTAAASTPPLPLNADDEKAYWQAAIACLPDPAKREAAQLFWARHVEGHAGSGVLAGLLLLLEANGCWMQSWPRQVHDELLVPGTAGMQAILADIRRYQSAQSTALSDLQSAAQVNAAVAEVSRRAGQDVESALRQAVDRVDVTHLAQHLTGHLEDATLVPFRKAVGELLRNTTLLEAATAKARAAADTCRDFHVGTMVMSIVVVLVVLLGSVTWWSVNGIKESYREQLAEKLGRLAVTLPANREAFVQLGVLENSIRLSDWVKADGSRIPDGYALILDDAAEAQTMTLDGKQVGVLFFHAKKMDPLLRNQREIKNLQDRYRQQNDNNRALDAIPVPSAVPPAAPAPRPARH